MSDCRVIQMPPRTYTAILFEVPHADGVFKLAGTLEGFIDFAFPQGPTYLLTLDQAQRLAVALGKAVADVRANCMYGQDALLEPEAPRE